MPQHIDLVRSVLLQQQSIQNCAVVCQKTETGQQQLIAYIVSKQPIPSQKLQSTIEGVLAENVPPINFIEVSNLPLTEEGEVDEEALKTIPVIDEKLAESIEEQLKSKPEIDRIAVVVQESSKQLPPLHKSDLLLNWQQKETLTPEEKRTEDIHSDTGERELLPLAIADGGPLPYDPDAPTTLAQALERAAFHTPTKGVIYIQSDGTEISQSYRDLLEDAQRIMAGLRKLGLKPQDKVIFQLDLNQDFIAAFWGCALGGFVPVPLSIPPSYDETNSTIDKLQNAWQMLEKPLILTSARLGRAVDSLSQRFNLTDWQVGAIENLRCHEPDLNWHASKPDDLALLMLTSGSTGMPKAVMLSHRNILSRAEGTRIRHGYTPQDISLNWFPLDHVVGLVMFHVRDIYLCCQQVHAPIDYILSNPVRWIDLLDDYRITVTWAPNFAYSLVNAQAEKVNQGNWDLSSVRYIINGAEAIVDKTARQFMALLSPHKLSKKAMQPAWGMSETSSGLVFCDRYTWEGDREDSTFVNLGTPIAGISLRVVEDDDRVVAEGTTGRLQIKGLTVTKGYYNNPQQNQEAFTADGWFNTGDLGFIQNGEVTITGRAKDVIIINAVNYYCHEIEAVVEEIEGIAKSFVAACGVRPHNSETDRLAIFFHSTFPKEADLIEQIGTIRDRLIRTSGINPDYLIPVDKEAIPKTTIGKIQRSQLKQRFETGEFQPILKQFDILTGNANTIPDWFYRKIWRPKQLWGKGQNNTQGVTLVFIDRLGLGSYLCDTLPEGCIAVEMGSEYIRGEQVCHIDPTNPEHYMQLVESVGEISQILHLWTYDRSKVEIPNPETLQQTQERGIYSLLFLVQALAKVRESNQEVRLLWISSQCQATHPGAEIAPAKSTVLGLLKTIPQELPWLSTCHIDLLPDEVEVNGQYIRQELMALSGEPEVAYREGHRLVCRLEKIDWQQEERQELPFKRGGIYLLSGGLGGIGCEIAKYLLQNYQTKLLLVGRSPLSEKMEVYRQLEQLDGEIIYEAVDICNLEQLQQVVTKALSRWGGELDGVIHLAGIGWEKLLLDETSESLAAMLRPKVLGTWVLHQLVKKRPNSLFISFSSINSFFGGVMAGAYSAANCFIESFAHYQKQGSKLQNYCLAWSSWIEIGMSQGNTMQELGAAKGYFAIPVEQGLSSLLAGLHYNQGQLLVGLDGSKRNIQSYLETKADNLQQLTVYFTPTQGNELSVLPAVSDRFGVETRCKFEQLKSIPLTETGEIDREQLLQNSNGKVTRKKIAPRNELERQLASIWQEVLEISTVGIFDNFFELGGNSIQAMILVNKFQKELSQILHPVALFDAPTIAELAAYLQDNYPGLVEKIEGKVVSSRSDASFEKLNAGQVERMRQYLRHHLCGESIQSDKSGQKNKQAIFILCPGRSGSTLLRVILAGNPQLFAPPELYLLSFKTLAERKAAFSGRNNFLTEGTIRAIMEIKNSPLKRAQEIMEELEQQNLSTKQFFRLMQEWLPDQILVDKTPPYAYNPQVLQRAESEFENPLYIHLLRHPLATIRSMEQARIDLMVSMAEDGFSVKQKGELMWLISHQNILEFLKNVPSDRQLRVKYEELVQQPQTTVNQLCEFIGVDFHADMLQPYQDKKQRMSDGIRDVSKMAGDPKFHTHKGIDAKAADRWKEDYQVDFLAEETWDIAESLGYDRPFNYAVGNYLPLTIGQEYMWLRPESVRVYYNAWRIWRIKGELNLKVLQEAIAEIGRRHASLHTTFKEVEGSVVQVMRPEMEPAFEVIDLPEISSDSPALWNYLEKFALHRFDLVNGPIVRINVLRFSETSHILMPCIHHTATDAWSWSIFIHELNALYSAFVSGQPSPLQPLPMTFTDFARWYQQWLEGGVLDKCLNYWRQNLAGSQMLELPCDRPLPANPTFRQGVESLKISPDLKTSLENISKSAGVALYTTLLSAFGVVLASLARQEEFVIYPNFSSRPRIEAQYLISCFINVLPMRFNLKGDPTFPELLDRVQHTFINGYTHNSLPLSKLMDIWQAQGKQLKYPLSASFNLINVTDFEQLELPGMKVSSVNMSAKILVYNLDVEMLAINGGYLTKFYYMVEVFDSTTIERVARQFHFLLESLATEPQKSLSDLLVMLDRF